MSTNQSTMNYLLDQLSSVPGLTARKMFGEYALQCNTKTVALVCDDQLYVKPTAIGTEIVGKSPDAAPYPGAKLWLRIEEDRWEDREWLSNLIFQTVAQVPLPKPKKLTPPVHR